jgi:hypothetical protein
MILDPSILVRFTILKLGEHSSKPKAIPKTDSFIEPAHAYIEPKFNVYNLTIHFIQDTR